MIFLFGASRREAPRELTGDPARHRRYGLLLDEALRRCPDGGGDDLHAVAVLRPCRGALSRARDAVKAACGSVDASVDAAAVLSSLSVSWRLPWLAVPQRVLLHRGPLAKSTKRGGTRRVVAAVCNDLLLYGTEGKAFRLRKVIPIAAAVVVDASLVYSAASAPVPRASKQARKLLDRMGLDVRGVDLDACSFLVESPQKGVVLTAPSPRDKLDWIAAFVAAQADKLHRRSKRDVKPPPARAKPPAAPALMPRRDAAPPAAKPLAEARTAPSKVPATFTL